MLFCAYILTSNYHSFNLRWSVFPFNTFPYFIELHLKSVVYFETQLILSEKKRFQYNETVNQSILTHCPVFRLFCCCLFSVCEKQFNYRMNYDQTCRFVVIIIFFFVCGLCKSMQFIIWPHYACLLQENDGNSVTVFKGG